jgi:hypothetical protein
MAVGDYAIKGRQGGIIRGILSPHLDFARGEQVQNAVW